MNNQKYFRPYIPETGQPTRPPPPQFRPYESDSDVESEAYTEDTGSVTTTTSSQEELPNFVEFATNLQLQKAGGPEFPTEASQLNYGENKLNKKANYSAYDQAFTITLPFDSKQYDLSGTKIWGDGGSKSQNTTSIIMLNSRDRDRSVYPNPSSLVLRLPRVYNNIQSLQIVQMKLLSSFLYFRIDKRNVNILINEFGRLNYNYLGQAIGQLNVLNRIREGTYNINTLIAELTIQLNTPPIFYDFPGGFNQFVPLFVSTGDFSINFNYPGDFFYDSLNRTYTAAPTRAFITSRYWQTQTLGFTPNLQQTKVAYYYPILREFVLDPTYGINKLDTSTVNTALLLPNETIYTRIVYAFQGVNDPVILALIDANVTALDQYRSAHTFRQSLINKYVVGYETYNNRIYIQSPSLNTSLVNLLNTQYAIFFANQLIALGISQSQYNQLVAINNQILSIVNAMYDYIQTQLAIFFGINFNTFAPVYFTQPNNYINIQNALNAIGVSSNYDINVIQNPNPAITTNIIEANRKDPQILWPNMKNLAVGSLGMLGYNTNLGDSNTPPYLSLPGQGSNHPYDITINNFNIVKDFIDADGDIYTDLIRKAGDIICPINAARYTVFRFRSLYRQTLQVETMPRPTQFRYPAYNPGNYNSNLVTVFDNSYSYVFNSSNANMDNVSFASLNTIPGFSNSDPTVTTNFGISASASAALWTTSLPLTVVQNSYSFVFYLPYPTGTLTPPNAYRHQMALTIQNAAPSTNIPSAMLLFLYHDRAAFMADLSGNARNESPLRYKQVLSVPTNTPSATLQWTAYAGQTYYAIARSSNISFTSFQFIMYAWYPDGTGNVTTLSPNLSSNVFPPFTPFGDPETPTSLLNWNYAQVNDPAFIRLPIQSNLWGVNPTGNEVNQGLQISNVPIGYDTNSIPAGGVSTDLTDYFGFRANLNTSNFNRLATVRVDPINGYFFQANSPYSPTAQSYFYPGASNFILAPINQSNYTPCNVLARQFKIVNWYDTTYLPDPAGSISYNPITDITPNISRYTLTSTSNVPITNYFYDGPTGNIQLGLGCCGYSFAPSDGIWQLDRVIFRSAFIQNDLNSNIAFLGVFQTSVVNTTPSFRLPLSNALVKLNRTNTISYPNAGSVNFGFDAVLGTYYEFKADTTTQYASLLGFSQNAKVLNNNSNNFYSIIPFDANSNVVTMHALTGSLVPYPYVTDASAGIFYFDGNTSGNGRGIVMPLAPPVGSNLAGGPPPGISYTLSAYEQSIPIGTQITHYLSQTDIWDDPNAFRPWSNVGYSPTQMFADVSGVMMMQSTDFKFYSYNYNTQDRQFTYLFNLTVDAIYPASETTALVAAAGNATKYAFLGFKVVGAAYQVRVKVYDVGLGTLYDIGVPATFQIPDLAFSVNSFSFTDTQGLVISGTSGGGQGITYRTPNLAAAGWIIDNYPGFTNVKSVQPPNSPSVYSLPLLASGNSTGYYLLVDENDTQANQATYTLSPAIVPNNLLVTRIPNVGDQIMFLTAANVGKFFTIRFITGSTPNFTATYEQSKMDFLNTIGNTMAPLSFVGGALGSKWAWFSQLPYIWGNRNDSEDAPILVQNAWQIFYPTTKIVLRKIANAVNPITDLSGLTYPEYPHTMMFAYNTAAAFSNQINSTTNPRWGFENSGGFLPSNAYNLNSNGFLVSDTQFSGYYFNSYIFNVPLLPNGGSNPEPYTYLVVRNYTPSEKSQTLLRFNLPQRYDFGFVRIRDLSNEPLFALANPDLFNPSYFTALIQFQSNFVFSNVNFGYNPTQNIPGSNITSAGFGDFVRQYTNLFNIYNSNVQIINTLTSNVNSNMQSFIASNLTYILPDYAKTRQNFTEAITFSILWRSELTPLFLKAEDDWGLGYNLGYAKLDTPYATIQRADSFFKILEDYIYLKLNAEYDMNRLDFGGKENLKETNEPTGNILSYNGKLLLNTFGNYAQTIIQNPVYFNPPLLKLDKLSFQWFDTVGQAITNAECEWNAAVQIVEQQLVPQILGKNPVIIPR